MESSDRWASQRSRPSSADGGEAVQSRSSRRIFFRARTATGPKRSQLMALEALRKLGKTPSRARRRYPRLLRQHRSRQADEASRSTRIGSTGAEADQAVARSWGDGRRRAPIDDAGVPQGGVISPLLANLYLHVLDVLWTRHSAPPGTLVRYADDLVVMCKTKQHAKEAEGEVHKHLARLRPRATSRQDETRQALRWKAGLRLSRLSFPQASERCDLGRREAKVLLQRQPLQRAMQRISRR